LAATAVAGAASSTLNAWLERDTDALMARTRNRPLPAESVQPGHALAIGLLMTAGSTAALYALGGTLAAAIGLGTILFYVVGYTWWLKPRTPQNIVIGGAAGSTAPMIAEAALNGNISMASVFLFLLVFLWTPPHFWAIAIARKEEYRAAGFPMMPIVAGDRATRMQSFGYTIALLACSLLPVPLGLLSWVYGVVALGVGAWFTIEVSRSIQADTPAVDYRVFRVSIVHLCALFVAMIVDRGVVG
jgi:protoheme IX farnesyltransferase